MISKANIFEVEEDSLIHWIADVVKLGVHAGIAYLDEDENRVATLFKFMGIEEAKKLFIFMLEELD